MTFFYLLKNISYLEDAKQLLVAIYFHSMGKKWLLKSLRTRHGLPTFYKVSSFLFKINQSIIMKIMNIFEEIQRWRQCDWCVEGSDSAWEMLSRKKAQSEHKFEVIKKNKRWCYIDTNKTTYCLIDRNYKIYECYF